MDETRFRGVMDIETEGGVKYRRFVVWSLTPPDPHPCPFPAGEGGKMGDGKRYTVREALHEAAAEYERLFGGSPQFAFMRKLPRGVELFTEFEGMLLLDAEWMLEKCVAVGGKTPLSPSTVTSPQMDGRAPSI